jgi:hypothetical protein
MVKVRVWDPEDVVLTVPPGGEYGTALQAASYQGNLGVVALLLEKGADPNTHGASFGIPRMSD